MEDHNDRRSSGFTNASPSGLFSCCYTRCLSCTTFLLLLLPLAMSTNKSGRIELFGGITFKVDATTGRLFRNDPPICRRIHFTTATEHIWEPRRAVQTALMCHTGGSVGSRGRLGTRGEHLRAMWRLLRGLSSTMLRYDL